MQNVLDLNEYGVAQMQNAEMVETDGGWLPLVVGLTGLTIAVLNTDWDEVANDIKRGYEDAKKKDK